jgi:hypothetical protein
MNFDRGPDNSSKQNSSLSAVTVPGKADTDELWSKKEGMTRYMAVGVIGSSYWLIAYMIHSTYVRGGLSNNRFLWQSFSQMESRGSILSGSRSPSNAYVNSTLGHSIGGGSTV